MKRTLLGTSYFILSTALFSQQVNYTQYVDPFIGTGGHGHTFPGATVPFGMVQLSPDTRVDDSWDGCSGYHYSDSVIYGFSHTHLSGTGCSDYGDIMLMPMMDQPSFDNKKYSSRFSHKNEKAKPGYYSVKLDDDNIDVELTATARSGFHKYTFNKDGDAYVVLDLTHRDRALFSQLILFGNKAIAIRKSRAWAQDQEVYSFIEFSQPCLETRIESDGKEYDAATKKLGGPDQKMKCWFKFKVKKGTSLWVKVGISGVDEKGAEENLKAENPGWDFEKIKNDADALWNKELSKVEVKKWNKAPNEKQDHSNIRIFYTALYHTMIQPNIYSDVDHRYRGRDKKIHTAEGFDYYTVFSLWDTFRAAHPLYTIIDTKRTVDFIRTFIAQYEQGGKLPVWELSSNETECMIGYHCVSVIADAMAKGIKGFDYEKAYAACKHSAMLDSYGLKAYKEKGFIETQDENENVSRTLEYAYDDWCISQMARILKKDSDYVYFSLRAQNWKNVFDPSVGFMRPRRNGGWFSPFDPKEVNNNFTEGNSWQYSFFVPQDVQGLIDAMGGSAAFEKKLDELFSTTSQTTGRDQPDISGLIGQYAHGNEPSHHMAYLYDYIGKPAKTQELVKRIMYDLYKTGPEGLTGNEDCGQMSAWYVLSAMGFYQVSPGSTQFVVGSPLFSDITIHLEDGKMLQVRTDNDAEKYPYITESNLNKTNHDLAYFSYADIMSGGLFDISIDGEPVDPVAHSWGRPLPFYKADTILPAPVFVAPSKVFEGDLQVDIQSPSGDSVFYILGDGPVDPRSFVYHGGTTALFDKATIHAFCKRGGRRSAVVTATYLKRPNNWKITLASSYSPQYTADGDEGVIDGLRGEKNWRKGGWQGYEGKDFECVIDLGEKKEIKKFSSGYLQDQGAWILPPVKVEYYVSDNGRDFTKVGDVPSATDIKNEHVSTIDMNITLKKPEKARYVKVKAYNYGKLPSWHEGAGNNAWLFIDEVQIE